MSSKTKGSGVLPKLEVVFPACTLPLPEARGHVNAGRNLAC